MALIYMSYKSLNKKLKEHKEEKKTQQQAAIESQEPVDGRHECERQALHALSQVKQVPAEQSPAERSTACGEEAGQGCEGNK
jgi:hypothetical protein